MLRKRAQHIGADRLLELIRGELLIGTWLDPGICHLTVPALLEALDQVAKPSAQYTPRTCTAEEPAQSAKHTVLSALLIVLAGSATRLLLTPAEHFCDLVPVLITRNSKKTQKCNHRRHSAAHFILLYVLSGTRQRHRPCSGTDVLFTRHDRAGVSSCAGSVVTEPVIGASHGSHLDDRHWVCRGRDR